MTKEEILRLASDAGFELQPTWQPIETAPENGQFLVYMPENTRQPIQVAKWSPTIKVIGNCFSFDMKPATHWMPLPEFKEES
jgi:hypothetical protein